MDSLFDEAAGKLVGALRPSPHACAAHARGVRGSVRCGRSEHVAAARHRVRHALVAHPLWPAGTGKTSLARIIAAETKADFVEVSAVSSGVAELRKAIEGAADRLTLSGQRTILFVDEIHRFTKSQQDALLHAVEDRVLVLIGATTENPFFEVNAPLISRSRVVELHPLSDEEVRSIVRRALDDERGLGRTVVLAPEAEEHVVRTAGGDARVALTTLEIGAALTPASGEGPRSISLEDVREATSTRTVPYDKRGDVHYDVISAFIKSMRGSDPDASVYWLARMIHGGEDPSSSPVAC